MSSFFEKLSRGMKRSRDSIAQMLPGGSAPEMSEADFMEIEDALILADCGAGIAERLVAKARKQRRQPLDELRRAMLDLLASEERAVRQPATGPFVLLVVGVNGTGKTTTIGKLAAMFAREGKRVLVGA
ncbi:MAG TPA: signal recognition particle receptor subunit alpha, partial [Mariprofundaceae bacterium]|nr:signal recognition particle receptor subunit alpha [Mariprofundaceae bacterium]